MKEQEISDSEMTQQLCELNKKLSELIQMQRKAVSGYTYMNANELAELLGESKKTIYARVHNRQIPYYKPGGKILMFKTDEIMAWIRSGRHASLDELKQNI